MPRNRPTKNLSLSPEVKSFLDGHPNASRLVDNLVSEHMEEVREEQSAKMDGETVAAVEALESLEGELHPGRAGVKYAAKTASMEPSELLELYEELQ
jgi:hypothetical protein